MSCLPPSSEILLQLQSCQRERSHKVAQILLIEIWNLKPKSFTSSTDVSSPSISIYKKTTNSYSEELTHFLKFPWRRRNTDVKRELGGRLNIVDSHLGPGPLHLCESTVDPYRGLKFSHLLNEQVNLELSKLLEPFQSGRIDSPIYLSSRLFLTFFCTPYDTHQLDEPWGSQILATLCRVFD